MSEHGILQRNKIINELRAEVARLRGELAEIEHKYRQALWLRHGHTALYGDDGEMQCAECHLDFKRDTLMAIELRLIDNSKSALKAAGKEKG